MPLGVKASNQIDIKTHQKIRKRTTTKFRKEILYTLEVLGDRELGHPLKRRHSVGFPGKVSGLS